MKLFFYPSDKVAPTRINHAINLIDNLSIGNKHDFDVCVRWDYRDISPPLALLDLFYEEGRKLVLNYRLTNVTKKAVDEFMVSALGYSSLVPDDYNGPFVSKRNKQSRGRVKVVANMTNEAINGDLDKYDEDYRIRQRLIDTTHNGTCVEYRVFVFGIHMFVLEKKKSKRLQFRSNATLYRVVDRSCIFSPEEIEAIERFCFISGLDLGEIDVLRDNGDGRIYIVDINQIPGGAGFQRVANGHALHEYIRNLKLLLDIN